MYGRISVTRKAPPRGFIVTSSWSDLPWPDVRYGTRSGDCAGACGTCASMDSEARRACARDLKAAVFRFLPVRALNPDEHPRKQLERRISSS